MPSHHCPDAKARPGRGVIRSMLQGSIEARQRFVAAAQLELRLSQTGPGLGVFRLQHDQFAEMEDRNVEQLQLQRGPAALQAKISFTWRGSSIRRGGAAQRAIKLDQNLREPLQVARIQGLLNSRRLPAGEIGSGRKRKPDHPLLRAGELQTARRLTTVPAR